MSTKTTFKRIALGTVAALGFGMLSIVAVPSANAEATLPVISVGAVTGARAGVAITVPVTVAISAHAANETLTVAAKAVSAPLTGGAANAPSVFASTLAGTNASGGAVLYFGDADGTLTSSPVYTAITAALDKTNDQSYVNAFVPGSTAAGVTTAAAAGSVPATALETALSSTANATTTKTFYLTVKPDLAGTYSILVSASGVAAHGSYVAGDVSTLVTFTTAAAPATATFTAIGGSSSSVPLAGTNGALYKVSFKDAAGNATSLAGDEAFTVTASAGYLAKATNTAGVFASVSPTAATSISFGAADLFNGVGFFNATYATASSTVILSGTGAGSSSIATTTATYSTAAAAANAASLTWAKAASANNAVTTGWKASGQVIPTTSTSDTIELTRSTTTAAAYGYLSIVDNSGTISGVSAGGTLAYDKSYSMAAATAYATVSIPHAVCVTGTCYTVTDSASTSIGAVTSEASALTSGTVVVASPASAIRLATGGTATISVTVRDQFRNLVPNTGVTVTFAGRNALKASATVVTNATGVATYVFTDAGTVGTSDSITFTATTPSAQVAVTYGDTAAGSVLVATPSTNTVTATSNAGADKYPVTYSEIDATGSYLYGAENGAVTVTALVKDANSNIMVGVPVTWTVTGTGCAITSTTATTYTGPTGQATASLYAWLAGNCVVTATAGGKSDTANSYWAQTGTTEVRTISSTVTGGSIVVVAKDRFGNPIAGVPLKATRVSGSGSFGGSSSATGSTDATGSQEFIVSNGDAKVTITFNDAAATTYGQSDALKGYADGTVASVYNVFLAYTAGTATVNEEGVGASFDAAGVNSLTVEAGSADTAQAAADAAAEATDAANAATDAANAAAEAADAATAAAQDAADAVAALSTQVGEMIDALKKQITALTNLVIKIQKKVKA